MTPEQYANFSNYAVASGTVVVALAFLSHVIEWGFARRTVSVKVAVGVDGPEGEGSGEADTSVGPDLFNAIGRNLSWLALGLLIAGLVSRGLAADRVPWGNMYEFGVLGATVALATYLGVSRVTDADWLGGIVSGFALMLLGISATTYVPAGPLVPALHSYWLVIHVAAVATAGGLFLVGAGASGLYLLKARAEASGTIGPVLARLPQSASMDRLAYQVHAVAFPIWTFGALIAGPIWAHYAWGRYWGWDPKEVWAFITWVVYAGYLHARATAGWRGRRAAILALAGFATFVFSFYGVNLFFSGLHSYAK